MSDTRRILAFETSCDETAVAIVEGPARPDPVERPRLLAQVVASQVDIHARYGGIVPEVASRQHLLTILPALKSCLEQARLDWGAIDAIAVTYGPGLAGALIVGLSLAKSLAFARRLPLIPINHLEGHVYANWLLTEPAPGRAAPDDGPLFPAVALIVSGAHSDLLLMEDHGRYRPLGATRDDAAGEAFDKGARILGLGFPGGPAIQRAAERGDPSRFPLPRAWLPGSDDFSFSGLKTALLRQAIALGLYSPDAPEPAKAEGQGAGDCEQLVADLAASFQEAIADVLVSKTIAAAQRLHARSVLLAGGVAANLRLRQLMEERSPVPVYRPPVALCTDNAAMIGAAAFFHEAAPVAPWELDAAPTLRLSPRN